MQAGQSTYHPLHRPLTKQTNQTRIHTLVIFCHPFSGPDRQSGPELNGHKVRREEKKERERERHVCQKREGICDVGEKLLCVKNRPKKSLRVAVKYTSGGHMIKIDHVRNRAEMSAVYLADNKHMVGKQMTAVTGDHNVPSKKCSSVRQLQKHSAFGWQIKGRSRRGRERKGR